MPVRGTAPGATRTRDTGLRRALLYPPELRGRECIGRTLSLTRRRGRVKEGSYFVAKVASLLHRVAQNGLLGPTKWTERPNHKWHALT